MTTLKPMPRMDSIRKLGTGRGSPAVIVRTAAPVKAPGRPPTNPMKTTLLPRGPAVLHLGQAPKPVANVFNTPPAFFSVTATISNVEWIMYVASAKLFNDPVDPTLPPYTGARTGVWEYQSASDMASAPRSVGNSVSDFVYHLALGDIIVALDSFHWHTEGDPAQQARDQYVKQHAARGDVEVRVMQDYQLLADPTGNGAVRALADLLSGRVVVSPVRSGLAYAPRDLVFA